MSTVLNSSIPAAPGSNDATDDVLAEATADYIARLRAALLALHEDPLSIEAARTVSALL